MTTKVESSNLVHSLDEILLQVVKKPASDRRIIVVIPACQEAAVIAGTLTSLAHQTMQPTAVIVAANNCTDGTEQVARDIGALVFDANPNHHKKAGALNMVLEAIMPHLDDDDAVLVADADTILSTQFIEKASKRLDDDKWIGAVGGAFMGRDSATVLGVLQQMEYYRYGQQIARNGERAFVLSGTGSLFRVSALRSIREERQKRNSRLPRGNTSYYCIRSMTEDNEMTLALMSMRWKCDSPIDIRTTTDVMESPKMLWKQRERWYLGALWNLRDYGKKMPWYMRWVYWRQQLGLLLAVVCMALNLAFMVYCTATDQMRLGTFTIICLSLAGFVWIGQVASVWRMGRKPRLLALIGIDQIYSVYLMMIFAHSFLQFLRGNRGGWTLT